MHQKLGLNLRQRKSFVALMIGDYEALKKADIDSHITFEGVG